MRKSSGRRSRCVFNPEFKAKQTACAITDAQNRHFGVGAATGNQPAKPAAQIVSVGSVRIIAALCSGYLFEVAVEYANLNLGLF